MTGYAGGSCKLSTLSIKTSDLVADSEKNYEGCTKAPGKISNFYLTNIWKCKLFHHDLIFDVSLGKILTGYAGNSCKFSTLSTKTSDLGSVSEKIGRGSRRHLTIFNLGSTICSAKTSYWHKFGINLTRLCQRLLRVFNFCMSNKLKQHSPRLQIYFIETILWKCKPGKIQQCVIIILTRFDNNSSIFLHALMLQWYDQHSVTLSRINLGVFLFE